MRRELVCTLYLPADSIATAFRFFAERTGGVSLPEWVPTPSNVAYAAAVEQLDQVVYSIIRQRRRQLSTTASSEQVPCRHHHNMARAAITPPPSGGRPRSSSPLRACFESISAAARRMYAVHDDLHDRKLCHAVHTHFSQIGSTRLQLQSCTEAMLADDEKLSVPLDACVGEGKTHKPKTLILMQVSPEHL